MGAPTSVQQAAFVSAAVVDAVEALDLAGDDNTVLEVGKSYQVALNPPAGAGQDLNLVLPNPATCQPGDRVRVSLIEAGSNPNPYRLIFTIQGQAGLFMVIGEGTAPSGVSEYHFDCPDRSSPTVDFVCLGDLGGFSSGPPPGFRAWYVQKIPQNGAYHKRPVQYATVAQLSPSPTPIDPTGVGGVGFSLQGSAIGQISGVDSVPAAGESILVKDESTPAHNGIYQVRRVGDGSTTYLLTRRTDMHSVTDVAVGASVLVNAGGTHGGQTWEMEPTSNTDQAWNWTQLDAGGAPAPELVFGNVVNNVGFSASSGTIHLFDGTATLTATLPAGQADNDVVGLVNVGTGGVLTVDGNGSMIGAGVPSLTLRVPPALLIVLRWSATASIWEIASDYTAISLLASGANRILTTNDVGGYNLPDVAANQVVGRFGSASIDGINIRDLLLPWSSLISGSGGPFPSVSMRTNPYSGGSSMQVNLPAGPTDGDEIAFKEVAGATASVTFSGNGTNIESPAGVVGPTFSTTTARSYFRFKFYATGGYWAFVR